MNLIFAALLVVLAGPALGDIEFEVNLQPHLEKMFEPRYPISGNMNSRERVQQYIKDKLTDAGVRVHEQKFQTTVNADPEDRNSEQIIVEGTNIIGVVDAVTEHPGAVVVVGADYDSNGITNPVFRNGAGVAALLEAAHLFNFNGKWSGRFARNYTTIFVAFDINTKLHLDSPGEPGSQFFVREWLWPFLSRKPDYFGGAVLFDSIMNVNYEENTQDLGPDFKNNFPDTERRVKEGGSKGDFLALVSKSGTEAATILKDQFLGNYNKDRKARRFRVEDIVIKATTNSMDEVVQEFFKTDAMHFWTFKDPATLTSVNLPAILLTDTTTYRPDPTSSCPRGVCAGRDILTEERLEFLEATVRGTVHFLLKRQATLLPDTSMSPSTLPSLLMTLVMMLIVRLYK